MKIWISCDMEGVTGIASYISGSHKPHYMMQGLDASADAIFFAGYHGSISGPSSTLSHTGRETAPFAPDAVAVATKGRNLGRRDDVRDQPADSGDS